MWRMGLGRRRGTGEAGCRGEPVDEKCFLVLVIKLKGQEGRK